MSCLVFRNGIFLIMYFNYDYDLMQMFWKLKLVEYKVLLLMDIDL